VTITRPHHPLHGQEFEVLRGGNERITIRLADGTSMLAPRRWTDADGVMPSEGRRRGGFFTIHSLRRLVVLVEAFLGRGEALRP
jgi:hypothetical protein